MIITLFMTCKGIHNRYKASRQGPFELNGSYGIYKKGFKRCSPCSVYYDQEELKAQNLSTILCPCCKKLLKSKPNNKKFREKLNDGFATP